MVRPIRGGQACFFSVKTDKVWVSGTVTQKMTCYRYRYSSARSFCPWDGWKREDIAERPGEFKLGPKDLGALNSQAFKILTQTDPISDPSHRPP